MGRRKKEGTSGAVTAYISRNQARKKLQLSLRDFRRICIMKGIYPVEPTNKKVNKGTQKTFYNIKDIRFLLHEPVIEKFRAVKAYSKKLRKAKGKKETTRVKSLLENKPKYKLDHIVKERYPKFMDAIRDLDDCLTLTHLFATFPIYKAPDREAVGLCRRLTVEFQHYVIQTRSLRKVFISIKGIYYQAEVKGQLVTWVTPHKVCYEEPESVDFRVMATFVEFYTTLLGFINFRLYNDFGLIYPPKVDVQRKPADTEDFDSFEYVEALNNSLKTVTLPQTEEIDVDEFPAEQTGEPDAIDRARLEAKAIDRLTHLFDGLKFFLNREVPRESLAFIIRCCGGDVSWDTTTAPGSTYQSTDECITHHIVDRPQLGHQLISRYYVQPQWVYDCINARQLLPVKDYLPGAILPAHLSPFVEEREDSYVPPERLQMLKGAEESEEEDFRYEDKDDEEDELPKKKKRKHEVVSTLDPRQLPKNKDNEVMAANKSKKIMTVRKGRADNVDELQEMRQMNNEEKKLVEMMIPNKKKRLYNRIMNKKKQHQKQVRRLQTKRKAYDAQQAKKKQKISD